MTKALEDAFKEAQKLSEADQDQLAAAIQDELQADKLWEQRLAASRGTLEQLADEALAEHRSGHTKPLDPEAL